MTNRSHIGDKDLPIVPLAALHFHLVCALLSSIHLPAGSKTMPAMDYRDPHTQCREELSNCLVSLEHVRESLRPTALAFEHLDHCLDELVLGSNPTASGNAIKAAQVLLRIFLRDFQAADVVHVSPEVFDPCTEPFADIHYSAQWAEILSDEAIQFCVIVWQAIERLQYCSKNCLTLDKDEDVFKELFDAFGAVKSALHQVDSAEKSLRAFCNDSNALALVGHLFENEVYCHLMRSIVPAVKTLLERVFNRLGEVDYLTSIASELGCIQRYEDEISGLDSSARLMLMDLGDLTSYVYSLGSLVDPQTWSESVLGSLLSTVLTMIRAMERLERVLDYRRLFSFARLSNEVHAFQAYRDVRKILRLLGRVGGSTNRSVSNACNFAKDCAIVRIPGAIEVLCSMKSLTSNPLERRVAACKLWKSYICWLGMLEKAYQYDASESDTYSEIDLPVDQGGSSQVRTDLCPTHSLHCQ